MKERLWRRVVLICFAITVIGGAITHARLWDAKIKGEDVYWSWLEGKKLLDGGNPYERILQGNMRDNDKYATYLPVFYYATVLTILLGFDTFETGVQLWRVIFLTANLGIAGLLLYLPFRRQVWLLSILAPAFWLFNRWTLHVTRIAHIDFLAIFPLIVSLALFSRHRYAACLLLGLSISIKQIGIMLIPLYLLWIWRETADHRVRSGLVAVGLIVVIPVLISLPFLVWNPEAYLKSVMFDAVRNPADHFSVASFDALIGWIGLPAKAPMFVIMALVLGLAWQRRIGKWTSVMLVMAAFVDFSSVLFRQYFVWLVPFMPLAVLDLLRSPMDGQPVISHTDTS